MKWRGALRRRSWRAKSTLKVWRLRKLYGVLSVSVNQSGHLSFIIFLLAKARHAAWRLAARVSRLDSSRHKRYDLLHPKIVRSARDCIRSSSTVWVPDSMLWYTTLA